MDEMMTQSSFSGDDLVHPAQGQDDAAHPDFLLKLDGLFPDQVVAWCSLIRMNGSLDDCVAMFERLYDGTNQDREKLQLIRNEACQMFLALLNRVMRIQRFRHHHIALRACLLVIITRIAL